jgi:ABC-type phosphate transport system substrate-binding protein
MVVVTGWATVAAAKDIAVISHKGNSVTSLTVADLAKLCKGQTARWSDGKPVTCVIRQPGSPEMKVVLEKVYSVGTEDLVSTIATANRGRTHPAILVVDSNDELVKKVQSLPGSLGMVDVYSITGGVNVIRVGGKLPLEPGYPIHGN